MKIKLIKEHKTFKIGNKYDLGDKLAQSLIDTDYAILFNELDEQILEASEIYYDLIAADHHKERDCHFYISKQIDYCGYGVNELNKVNYPQDTGWVAQHIGYCNEEFEEWFETKEQAQKHLLRMIKQYIKNEIRSIDYQKKHPEECDFYYSENAYKNAKEYLKNIK